MRTLRLIVAVLLLWAGAAAAEGFVFKDLQGHQQRLQDYRGKWVLVNFWATWCPPCLQEIPDLVSLYEAHKKSDLVVIGVALDSTRESVVEFVAKTLDVSTAHVQGVSTFYTLYMQNTVGKHCPACGTVIIKEPYLGGAIYYCEMCQPL